MRSVSGAVIPMVPRTGMEYCHVRSLLPRAEDRELKSIIREAFAVGRFVNKDT